MRVSGTPPTTLIFGGSFDPPHYGHVLLPQYVAALVHATQVLFIPAAKAPHKLDRVQTAAHHRLAMLRIALKHRSGTRISSIEIDRAQKNPDAPSYTIDTLTELKAQLPDQKFRLLIGSDQLAIFHLWKDWRKVVELAEPVVMVRAPHTIAEVMAQLPQELDPAEWKPRLVEVPAIDMSSTEIRRQAAAGQDVIGPTGFGVAAYIQEHHLYRP